MSIAKLTTPYTNPYVVSLDDVDLIKIRSLEAAPLTHEDLDDNFANLAYKINDLIEVIGGSSAVITADADGNVGIGTADPEYTLHVKGSATNGTALFENDDDSASGAPDVFLRRSSDTPADGDTLGHLRWQGRKIGVDGAHSTVDYADIYSTIAVAGATGVDGGAGNLIFRTRQTTGSHNFMAFNDSGYLGIGTTEPNEALHVNGNIQLNNWVRTIGDMIISADFDDDNLDSSIRFNIDGNDAADEKMRITSDGKVGIGTTSPTSIFEISSSAPALRLTDETNNTAAVFSSNNEGDAILNADLNSVRDNSAIRLRVDGTERMHIDSDGNVGIGSTSPSHKLTIGSPTTAGTTSQSLKIYRGSDDGGQNLEIGYNNITITRDSNDLDDPQSSLAFNQKGRDGTRTVMQIASNGNVGIGTASPQEAFHLKGDHKRMFIGSDDYNLFALSRRSSTEPDTAYLQMNDEGTKKVVLDTNGDSYFLGGNLGVGTDNPGALLTIEGTGSDNVQAGNLLGVVSDVNGKLVDIRLEGKAQTTGATMAGSVGFDPNNNCVYLANDNDQTLNVTSGNVGIGTTSPSAKVEIKTSSLGQEGIIVRNSLGNITSELGGHTTDGSGYLTIKDKDANNQCVLRNNGDSYLNALGGNVGIGTTTPAKPLEIQTNSSALYSSGVSGNLLRLRNMQEDTTSSHCGIDLFAGVSTASGHNPLARIHAVRENDTDGKCALTFATRSTSTISEAMRIHSGGIVDAYNNIRSERSIQAGHNTTSTSTILGVAAYDQDTANGGANPHLHEWEWYANGVHQYFGLYDRTATEYRLTVDYDGNVGIGTTDPDATLHIHRRGTVSGDQSSPALILDSSGSYANYAGIEFKHSGVLKGRIQQEATGRLYISSTYDATSAPDGHLILQNTGGNVGIGTTEPVRNLTVHGGTSDIAAEFISSDAGSYIAFEDNSTTDNQNVLIGARGDDLSLYAGSEERVRIDSDGNVGIDTLNFALVEATSGQGFVWSASNGYGVFARASDNSALFINKSASASNAITDYINFRNSGVNVGRIEHDGTDVVITQLSDERLKENIQDSESGLNIVNSMHVRSFDWIDGFKKSKKFGFVAQELYQVFEDAVGVGGDDAKENPWTVSETKLIPVLTKAIQEQQQIIEDLKSRIVALEGGSPEPEKAEPEEALVDEPQAESDSNITTKEDGKEYIRIGDKEYEVLGRNEDGSLILDDDVTNNA